MVKSAFAAVAFAVVCSAVITEARVTRIEIAKVERVDSPSPGAQGAIQTPPYERMSGKFYGELDPAVPKSGQKSFSGFRPPPNVTLCGLQPFNGWT